MDVVDLFSLDQWVRHVRGGVHFTTALLAVLLGPYTLLRHTKGDNRHRMLGRIWVVLMLVVNGSAFTMFGANGTPSLFHAFAILSLWAVIPGFLAIRRYRHTRNADDLTTHIICMHWAVFGLVAAALWQLSTRYLVFVDGRDYGATLWTLAVLTGLGSWWFSRWLNARFAAQAEGA
ncbi:MAG: DUF2306 domain-containing protein [Pseudomonadota bacterium]